MPNITTLLAMVVFTPAVAGCLLLLSWLQHPRQLALGVWGSGFLTASVAATLVVVGRGVIPNFWSIIVGNPSLLWRTGLLLPAQTSHRCGFLFPCCTKGTQSSQGGHCRFQLDNAGALLGFFEVENFRVG
jgi:hypothetical protein